MILRRLSHAFRKQDWFTVAVEIMIVVLGVFIGLQVNNWNAARVEQVEQTALLQRLQSDFSTSEPVMQGASERLHLASSQTAQLIEYLRASDAAPDDKDIQLIVEAPLRLGSVPSVTATYQEMLSTGGLSRIRHEDLRNALVRYGQNDEKIQSVFVLAIEQIMNSDRPDTISSAIQMTTDLSSSDGQSGVVSFDWQKLQAAEPQIYAIFVFQNILSQLADAQLAEVRNILALLEAETQ